MNRFNINMSGRRDAILDWRYKNGILTLTVDGDIDKELKRLAHSVLSIDRGAILHDETAHKVEDALEDISDLLRERHGGELIVARWMHGPVVLSANEAAVIGLADGVLPQSEIAR